MNFKETFKEKIVSDYCREIIEKSSELEMLKANINGLYASVADMISRKIRDDFRWKALLTPKTKTVWRVVETDVHPYGDCKFISVSITLAGNPSQIVGNGRKTEKEKALLKRMQELWDKQSMYCLSDDFMKLATELLALSHGYKCVKAYYFEYTIEDLMEERNLLNQNYVFNNLEQNQGSLSSSSDDLEDFDMVLQTLNFSK